VRVPSCVVFEDHDSRGKVRSYAQATRSSADVESISPMFQDGFIKETLDTLALLFPESDRKRSGGCQIRLEQVPAQHR
jgi:hypothetical protein